MRSKKIVSAVVFIAAFGLSAALAGLFVPRTDITTTELFTTYNSEKTSCFKRRGNSTAADKIAAFVNQDKQNGRESDRAYYRYGADIYTSSDNSAISGYAVAVAEYVDDSSSMNVQDLPGDFQSEWREHMQAWRDYSNFLNRMERGANREGLTVRELNELDAAYDREISRTWNAVLQNGREYGADVY